MDQVGQQRDRAAGDVDRGLDCAGYPEEGERDEDDPDPVPGALDRRVDQSVAVIMRALAVAVVVVCVGVGGCLELMHHARSGSFSACSLRPARPSWTCSTCEMASWSRWATWSS